MNDGIIPARPHPMTRKLAWFSKAVAPLAAIREVSHEALAASEYLPDWVAGISIGAINAAVIAGNAPEHRVQRLRRVLGGDHSLH